MNPMSLTYKSYEPHTYTYESCEPQMITANKSYYKPCIQTFFQCPVLRFQRALTKGATSMKVNFTT